MTTVKLKFRASSVPGAEGTLYYQLTNRRKTVFTFLQEQASRKEQMQRHGTARTYGNAYRRFREFRRGVDLAFDELSPDMMERYEAWLIGRRLRQNSISCYLRTLNTLFYKAVEEGLLTDRHLFSRVRLSYVKTAKRAIGEKNLKSIASLPLPEGSTIALARDMNIPVAIISEGMGHNSLKTTQVYLNSIDTSKINEANKRIIRRISKG